MSMIAPITFVEEYKDYSYDELLPVRDGLIRDIVNFEQNYDPKETPDFYPTPSTRYNMSLEYLSELCKLIAEKHRENAWEE